MSEYVLYCLDGLELVRRERFSADGDDQAVAEALNRRRGQAAELWSGARRVGSFPADDGPDPERGQ